VVETWFLTAQVRPFRFAAQGPLRASTAFRVLARPSAVPCAAARPGRFLAASIRSTPDPASKESTVNSVVLIGRLTANPTAHAGEKHESATFRLAVPRPGSDAADFIEVVAFDKLAATCAEWLSKGREVAVVGRLRLNEWITSDGERRSRVQVVADAVQFLGAPTKPQVADDEPEEPPAKPAPGAYRRKAS
jgi:single-strand DNA-binding protein